MKVIQKSSKRKQRLYEKFLKHRNEKSEEIYKNYKRLFEVVKKNSKRLYYSNLIIKYKNNIKKTWSVIKEAIGKEKIKQQNFPKKIRVGEKEITDLKAIAANFNKFFTEIGPNLAKDIYPSLVTFETYLKRFHKNQKENDLTINELKEAFFSLKTNKSPGYDDINFNVIRQCFGSLHKPLLHVFSQSLKTGVFPDELKIARVSPLFKKGDDSELGNYRPISVLPCFSKVLEKIMHNRLYKHLSENNLLYKKQFGFQQKHSTEHAIIQLIDQINKNFEKSQYTLGIFIDLTKAFDTVDHNILISKLENYGVRGVNLKWFKSYLNNRKQFISYNNSSTSYKNMTCGVPQGSILGPLLFLIYINDLREASNILDPIMFADDTNLFYSHHQIKVLFETVNAELQKISQWFRANKLSLNVKKTNYTLFHKCSLKDKMPLKLPELKIGNNIIEKATSIKFLGVMIDENISWRDHIKTVENKLSKNIGLLYQAKQFLDENSLKTLYFSYIHSYLDYANIAWASTHFTKLKTISYKQKQATRIVFNEDRLCHSRPLLRELNALNIYQINLFQVLKFMHRFTIDDLPKVFKNVFKKPDHKYPTKFAQFNYSLRKHSLSSSKFSISYRGAKLWNEILSTDEKELKSHMLFQTIVKSKLLAMENELSFF